VLRLLGGKSEDDVELLRLRAEALLETGDGEHGVALLRRIVERDPDGRAGLFARARMLEVRSVEQLTQACDLYERAAKLDPSFGDALAEEGMLLAPLCGRSRQDFERAFAVSDRAVAADPTSPRAYYARSYATWAFLCAHEQRGEPVPPALVQSTCSDLRTAYALEPRPMYRVYAGKTLIVAGRPREGLPELEAVVDAVPRGDPAATLARTWRGNARFALGDEPGAVDDWLAALAAGPKEAAAECLGFAERASEENRRRLQNAGLERRR
jgi:tetratricopeptide (TPR) repeat protein